MNHGHHIKYKDIIRFRSGDSALMKVKSMDTLCGYITYHGTHLYGEKISVSGHRIQHASKEDLARWNKYRGERVSYAHNINDRELLEWAS